MDGFDYINRWAQAEAVGAVPKRLPKAYYVALERERMEAFDFINKQAAAEAAASARQAEEEGAQAKEENLQDGDNV